MENSLRKIHKKQFGHFCNSIKKVFCFIIEEKNREYFRNITKKHFWRNFSVLDNITKCSVSDKNRN